VAWEGDFEALHSLAIVNRAMCRGLIDRGHDEAEKVSEKVSDTVVLRDGENPRRVFGVSSFFEEQ
jgi:hypothetical protein